MRQRGPTTKAESELIASLPVDVSNRGRPDNHPVATPAPALTSSSNPSRQSGSEKLGPATRKPELGLKISPNMPGEANNSPSSPSKPNSSRRRRNHKRNTSTQVLHDKQEATPHPDERIPSPLVPSEISQTAAPKETPPHLLNSAIAAVQIEAEVKSEDPIDSLVEHVRSMAMEKHRPDSPSGHIDWAGIDDDDSLPDLEDWGFSSKTVNNELNTSVKVPAVAEPLVTQESKISEPISSTEVIDDIARKSEKGTESENCPASPVVKKERRRERGSRKGDKRGRNGQTGGTTIASQSGPSPPKKSLAERLSSPVRHVGSQPRGHLKQIPPTAHSSSPLKSTNGLPSTHSPSNSVSSTRIDTSPVRNRPASPQSSDTAVASSSPERKDLVLEKLAMDTVNEVVKTTELPPSGAFDWAEEPLEPIPSQTKTGGGLEVEIQPPTPLEEISKRETRPQVASSRLPRHQRPMSTDITQRNRRERSPHKAHNAKNHSTPNATPAPDNTRARAPRTSRPMLRPDAFAMLSRNLRDSPSPRRHESPNPPAST